MSFTKKISFLVLSVLIFSIALTSFAQSTDTVSQLEPVDCFAPGLYKFQSVQVSAGPEKQSYAAGENIRFVGDVINENSYPVVDGSVFVRISKDNPNFITDGHNTVAEMIAVSNVAVDASSSLPINFSWMVPKALGAGDYRADYFFSVGNKFNLGGLPFTNEIIIGFSSFKITGTQNTEFILDRTSTMVNGEKYNHIGNWPFVKAGEKIEIIQPIKNLSSKEIKVEVGYDLYFWDSLNVADRLDGMKETVTVPANSTKNLSYIIPESKQSVYYLNIKATVGGASSIVNIRTTSDIEKARINYPAITAFPLMKGDTANLFSCFHAVYGTASSSKLILTLTDKDGNNVAKGQYDGVVGSDMSAALIKFSAEKNYTFLSLKAELFDGQNKLVDSYKTNYDCSILGSEKCEAMKVENININLLYSLLLVLISLVSLLFILKKVKSSTSKKIYIVIFIILLILSLCLTVYVLIMGANKVVAENVSADGKTKTETKSASFSIYDGDWSDCRLLTRGTVSMTYQATLTGNTTLLVGDGLTVSSSQSCSFNASGGAWDTPVCGSSMSFTDGNVAGNHPGSVTLTNEGTSVSLTSSNTAVVTCSGSACTAVGPGTATVSKVFGTTNVPPTKVTFKKRSGTYTATPTNWWAHLNDKKCNNTSRNLPVAGYSASWNVTVATPTPPNLTAVTGSCDNSKVSLSWPAVSGATGYKLYKNGTLLISTTSLSYSNLNSSSTDSFVVRSTYGAVDSAPSTPAVSATPSDVCPPLTLSCIVSPNPATVNQDFVRLTANASGGAGPYWFSWVGTGGLPTINSSSTASSLLYRYTQVGNWNATSTVSDGVSTTTVICREAVAGGGGGCSHNCIDIRNPVPMAGICAGGLAFPTISNLQSAPTLTLCPLYGSNPTFITGTWSWTCSGINLSPTSSPICMANQIENATSTYNCSSIDKPTSLVNVNTNTRWLATSSCPSCTTQWNVTDSNSTSTAYVTGVNPLNKIFTTIGLKTVKVKFASTTNNGELLVGEIPCTATTTVVQTGGSNGER